MIAKIIAEYFLVLLSIRRLRLIRRKLCPVDLRFYRLFLQLLYILLLIIFLNFTFGLDFLNKMGLYMLSAWSPCLAWCGESGWVGCVGWAGWVGETTADEKARYATERPRQQRRQAKREARFLHGRTCKKFSASAKERINTATFWLPKLSLNIFLYYHRFAVSDWFEESYVLSTFASAVCVFSGSLFSF